MDTSRANMKSMVHLSLMQVLMLNSVVCGLEFCASAAFTYIPPLLLKSGLSEEHMSFVLGIGPFLGFLLVPWIGHSSDNCRSRFGRRRPYILALSILLIVALVMIPYGEFFGVFALGPNAQSRRLGVGLLIVGSVLLDFTSQACLTPCEALLSDACKDTNQQDRAFMVYSFMVSIGGCIGYLITALDWTGSAVGLYFGSQERSAFSVLIILFSFSLFFTLVIAEEKPLRNAVKISGDKTQRTDDVEADNLIAKSDKTLGNTASIIPPQDPGYESGDNYYNDESYNPPPSANLLTGNGSNLPSPMLMQRTLSIPMTRFSVTLARFDALLCLVVARCYRYMPRNLRTICEMPAVLKRLAVAHFFSWTGIMAFNLYFTDFVGQIVYKGNPNAPEDSEERALFDAGVRMGSWGLLIHCITSAIYALFVEKINERWGPRTTYLIGMSSFTLSMAALVFTTNVVLVNVFAACTGIGFATLTTIPFLLIHTYHDNKEIYYYDVYPDGTKPRRGMGTDMASLDAAYFLSQVVLTLVMSSVVYLTGTVVTYMVVAAGMSAVSCASAFMIVVEKKDVAVMLKR